MFSSAAAVSAVLLLPIAFAQNTTTASTDGSTTGATAASGTGTAFTAPTVTGTSCGTSQQNFNQCVTKVSKDISSCPSTGYVCLCQTYANLAACYNACPDLTDGATWKDQSKQYCTQANISDTGSVYNTTSTTTTTTTTTPTTSSANSSTNTAATTGKTNNTTSSTAPATTAGSFARNSANRCLEISSSLVVLVVGACAVVFA